MSTPDQVVAEGIGSQLDARIAQLNAELALLQNPAARIAEIQALLVALAPEKTRIDPRRPPRPPAQTPLADQQPGVDRLR